MPAATELPAWASFACGGAAASVAEIATLPIDTAKVRLQLLRGAGGAGAGGAGGGAPMPSMFGMMRAIARDEGARGLFKGLAPAIQRQLVFASLRIGLYAEISARLREPGATVLSLERKIFAGLLSGAIGITVANVRGGARRAAGRPRASRAHSCLPPLLVPVRAPQPTDLVKVRMQSEGRLAPGVAPRYSGVFNAYATIVRAEGVLGLWTGLGPAIMRNSIINATELASYETAKEALVARGAREGVALHVASATAAGLMATLIGNPVDVVKTRVMAARGTRGALAVIADTLRDEGPRAFYKGVVPQFFRLTGWSIVMFSVLEQLKARCR